MERVSGIDFIQKTKHRLLKGPRIEHRQQITKTGLLGGPAEKPQ